MIFRLFRNVAVLLFVTYASLFLISSAAYATNEQKLTTVSVIWEPGDEQPFYYANAKDLWSKYGIKIRSIQVQDGTAELSAIASGSADIALFGSSPFVSGVGKGINMVAVYATVDPATLEGLYVRPSSGIRGLHDLIGKSVAVPFGSSADCGLRFGLEKKGINASRIHIENMAPAEMLAGFERGNINAVYIWSTWGQRLLALGAKLVATDASDGVNAGPTVVAVRRAYLKNHQGVVARFLAAMDEGARGANRNPRVAAQALHELTKVTLSQGLAIASKERSLTLKNSLNPKDQFSLVNNKTGLAHIFEMVATQLKQEGLISSAPKNFSSHVSSIPAMKAQELIENGGHN